MNIADQIEWEQECAVRGSERYCANQQRLKDTGQVEQTDTVSYLLQERLIEVATILEFRTENKKRGKSAHTRAKYKKYLKMLAMGDYTKVAYMGVTAMFKDAIRSKKDNKTLVGLCASIGKTLEVEAKCTIFQNENEAYYNKVIQSFKSQKLTDVTHMQKVLMLKFKEFDMKWNELTTALRVVVGQIVVAVVMEVFPEVFYIEAIKKPKGHQKILSVTMEFEKWLTEFETTRGFMYPYLLPLKIQPVDWDGEGVGGYYTHTMKARLPLIKTRGKEAKKFIKKHTPKQHIAAINKIQKTKWCINQNVFDIQKEVFEKGLQVGLPSNVEIKPPPFPEHLKDIDKDDLTEPQKEEVTNWKVSAKEAYRKEMTRKGKVLLYMQGRKLAEELYEWDEFYFAYNCDFRGRIYCATAVLSPQGADTAKGLLQFKDKVVLGDSGVRWLAVHGANTYGNDKVSYGDRVSFIQEHERAIRETVIDPISSRDYWGAADKPYQFLAFCFEWANCDYGRNPKAESQIPVGQDGSCNGLQHFSAMLRDEVGGRATNLLPCDKPMDIYQEVADVCADKLRVIDNPMAQKLYTVGITRKCAKRPVMTLPYGATQRSARMYILDWLEDNWSKFDLPEEYRFQYANYLTPILWESIGEVVIAARAAMSWLKRNTPKTFVKWVTPLGFPVYQHYAEWDVVTVRTQLNGGIRLTVGSPNEAHPKVSTQRSGISPNFVHSIDSSHMVLTVNNIDAPAFAMIHDDFGVHAGHSEHLASIIRKAFKYIYMKYDPLESWATQVGLVGCSLERGDLDITEITEAQYFFG
jgi:DNA-directed RNA polymerase